MGMRFSIATLGCKINQYDSQWLRAALQAAGHVEQDFGLAGCDLHIINSCIVTQRSTAENRKLIRRALGLGGRVILTGCQARALTVEVAGLSQRLEIVALAELPAYLGLAAPAIVRDFSGHRRAFVKVQSGCNNFCSYCIVPFSRGLPVSRPLAEIIDEINALAAAGFREVVLCGINLGLYAGGVVGLMRALLAETDMPRLRLSSLEPWTLAADFCELFAAETRICRHLHLPLQSGNDAILAAMRRPYRREYYRALLTELRQAVPQAALGTDVLVGFPGEDQTAFEDGLAFINELPLSYLHVFPYSRRPGTAAADFADQVPELAKKERAARLRQLSGRKQLEFEQACLGTTSDLLVSRCVDGIAWGATSNYLKLKVAAEIEPYATCRVRVIGRRAGSLWGEVVAERL